MTSPESDFERVKLSLCTKAILYVEQLTSRTLRQEGACDDKESKQEKRT